MKRILFIVVAVLSLIFIAVGCSDKSKPEEDLATEATGNKKPSLVGNAEKTITYYVWGNQNEFNVINQIVDAFKEQNPGVDVKIERSTSDYYQQLRMRMGTNSGPDVFFMDVSEYAMFANHGFLMPLDDYINNSETLNMDDLWPINDMYRFDGQEIGQGNLYALIKDWSPNFVLFYNKDHFDEMGIPYPDPDKPMSWDEFEDIARKLTKRSDSGRIMRYGTIVDYDPIRHLQEWINMAGGQFYSDDLKTLTIDAPEAREAIDFYIRLQSGDDAPARYSTESTAMNGGDMFANGLVSMVFYGRWAVPAFFDSVPELNYGYALPPVPAGSDKKGSMASGLISHAVNANSKNPELAFRFLEFLQTEGQEILGDVGFNIPGNKKVAESVYLSEEDPFKREMNEFFLRYANEELVKPVTNPYISQVTLDDLVGKNLVSAILGNISTEEAIQRITEQVNKELSANAN